MSVRHKNLTQHPTDLQQNRFCERRCSGVQMEKNEMGGHVACMGRVEAYTGICWRNQKEWDRLGDLGLDGRVLWISVSGMWRFGLDRGGSGYEQVADTCECGDETSGSTKCG